MAFYPEELIEEIRMKNDIVDVISGYVRLKKQGNNYFGLCPFHNEKSPSFSVSAGKQMFHCFGCGEGGNVFSFIQKYENFSFPEAVKFLADKAGVQLPEASLDKEAKEKNSKRARILELNKAAASFYFYMLRSENGKLGMDYLTGRGLSQETMTKFGLGYAGKGGGELIAYLKNKGFDENLMHEAGMINFDERNGAYDKFWNRVIFPLMDINNRVIGFGGRVMGDGKPKYLNSPETIVFDKSRNLFGLNFARTSRKKHMILCEGYMDVISMHQAGFTEAVASLGTAFTSGQASLLKHYTDTVILSYDSDEAGVKAILRAIPILKEAGLSGRVLKLAPYKDPDEFIKNEGAEAFAARLEEAESGFFFETDILKEKADMNDPESVTAFHKALTGKLLEFPEELERENYLTAVSRRYMIKEELLRSLVISTAAKRGGVMEVVKPRETVARKEADPVLESQKRLITWICDEPGDYDKIKKYIDLQDFTEDLYRRTAEYLFTDLDNGRYNPAGIISRFQNEDEQSEISALFNTKVPEINTKEEREKAIKDILLKVKKNASAFYNSESERDVASITKAIAKKKELEAFSKVHILL